MSFNSVFVQKNRVGFGDLSPVCLENANFLEISCRIKQYTNQKKDYS